MKHGEYHQWRFDGGLINRTPNSLKHLALETSKNSGKATIDHGKNSQWQR